MRKFYIYLVAATCAVTAVAFAPSVASAEEFPCFPLFESCVTLSGTGKSSGSPQYKATNATGTRAGVYDKHESLGYSCGKVEFLGNVEADGVHHANESIGDSLGTVANHMECPTNTNMNFGWSFFYVYGPKEQNTVELRIYNVIGEIEGKYALVCRIHFTGQETAEYKNNTHTFEFQAGGNLHVNEVDNKVYCGSIGFLEGDEVILTGRFLWSPSTFDIKYTS